MFRDFFGIEKNPFSNTPDPEFLFMSPSHKEALAHLIYGVEGNSGFVLLTGEVGTGKTTLCRYLADNAPENADLALCINPRLTEVELLASICDDVGVGHLGSRYSVKELTDSINRHLLDVHARGRRAVLVIDEAQNLGFNALEQVRLLTNLEAADTKLLQIILIGQPELRDIVEKPELRQLSQRITARYHLPPMAPAEVGDYVAHRLRIAGLAPETFSTGAINVIIENARGIPRLINSIGERCLLGAYAADIKTISADLAHAAAREVLGEERVKKPRRLAPVLAGVLVAILAAGTIALDPFGLNLAPAVSQSAAMTTARDRIRQWPGLAWIDNPCPGPDVPATKDANACR